jgi:hypothetical protein
MNSITKWLTGPDAANYPFPYQFGDRLKSPTKNIQGTVRNAKYAGPKQPGPAWLTYYLNDGIFTYYLETDNGQITKIPLTELWEIGVDIMIEAGSAGGLILTE